MTNDNEKPKDYSEKTYHFRTNYYDDEGWSFLVWDPHGHIVERRIGFEDQRAAQRAARQRIREAKAVRPESDFGPLTWEDMHRASRDARTLAEASRPFFE